MTQSYSEYLLSLDIRPPVREKSIPEHLSYIDWNLGYYLHMINKGVLLPLHDGEETIYMDTYKGDKSE